MVGPVAVSPAAQRELRTHVELVAPVPRPAVGAHYRWADVFLLPSLCEGSATVTYEALRAGLPVVCTAEAGSVVRDGVEGFIVPARSAGAIVAALERLAADPDRLCRMAAAAAARFAEFTLREYRRRLLDAIARDARGGERPC
jgi:glycosyltransferase involved in cell wall biosynthesis